MRATQGTVSAAELYGGDHWNVVRSLADGRTGNGESIRVWVCSAGIGLASLAAVVPPYAATFIPGDADSVARRAEAAQAREENREWWALLAQWEGPEPGAPRTLAELVRRVAPSAVVVTASEAYLDALADDLRQTIRGLDDPERLSILSAGSRDLEGLTAHLLPCDARLRPLVGGALTSLNVRVARAALLEWRRGPATRSQLRLLLERRLAGRLPAAAHRRDRVNGEEVQAFIRATLEQDPGARPTPLLRRLRDGGRACEHARFTALFRQVWEQLHGC
jgi:hypothetical protein